MNTFNDNVELEILKAQMSVLKSHLSNEAIISDEILNATIRVQVESLSAKKSQYLIKAAIALAMTLFFVNVFFGKISNVYLGTILGTGLYFTVLNLINYMNNEHGDLMSGSLTETARNITSWRKKHRIQALITALVMAIWIPVFFIEEWGNISTNIVLAIFVVAFLAFVINRAVREYIKVRKVSQKILTQIAEICE